jgi:ABC-2 type transport system ATP-binding protein
MLQIKGVSKSYLKGSVKAVDQVDMEVRAGEIFGFLGPNGAGKTTTIKMVVGLLKPDSGRITVDGVDAWGDPIAAKSRIGYVPDEPNLYDKLTGLEYLNFIGDVFRVPSEVRGRRVADLLETFELAGAVGDLVGSYSHGMKQKLAVIAAMMHEPSLFILDEPMTGLDPRSSHVLKELMRQHCDRGRAVFFSTHILEVAERLCDRLAIINHGKIIATGTMDELRGQAAGEKSLEEIFLGLTAK